MSMISKLTSSDTERKAVRRQPEQALTPFEEMDRYFDNMFLRGWFRPMQVDWPKWSDFTTPLGNTTPKVDVIDQDKKILVRAEVPGVDKDKLDVSVTDNAVTIKGTSKHEAKEEKGEYYRRETSYGQFIRTVALPTEVDSERAKANYQDGVLEIEIPKVEESKRRTIKVE